MPVPGMIMDRQGYSYSPYIGAFYVFPMNEHQDQPLPRFQNAMQYFGPNENVNSLYAMQNSSPAATANMSSSNVEADDDDTESAILKRVYEKWTDDEQRLLLSLWSENFEWLESKDSRNVWDEIADNINKRFASKRSKRPVSKFKNKLKYLVDRYKKAKDWNKRETGGHMRKSIFYEEIDRVLGCREIVELQNVEEAGTSSASTSQESSESQVDEESPKEKRTERKKKRKASLQEEANEQDRKLFKAAVSGLQA